MTERIERTDPDAFGAHRLFVASLDALTPIEMADLPLDVVSLFEAWPAPLEALPPALAWAAPRLDGRRAVLERVSFHEDAHAWGVRLAPAFDAEELARPGLSGDGAPLARGLPTPLGWLAETFGTASLGPTERGRAPFGQPLGEHRAQGFGLMGGFDDEEPEAAGDDAWAVLYELDGDVLAADLTTGDAYWVGHEWMEEPVTKLALPWPEVTQLIVRRLLDGEVLQPDDPELAAALRTRERAPLL